MTYLIIILHKIIINSHDITDFKCTAAYTCLTWLSHAHHYITLTNKIQNKNQNISRRIQNKCKNYTLKTSCAFILGIKQIKNEVSRPHF